MPKSKYFSPKGSPSKAVSTRPVPPLDSPRFGLIQETLFDNVFHLLIQVILWNQTKGSSARPVFNKIIELYPTPELLAVADLQELTAIIQPIGLHNVRAKKLITLSSQWLLAPPDKSRRYRKLDYPCRGDGRDIAATEILDENDSRQGWEIAHLYGIGAYALDSYRMFSRDVLRGSATGWNGEGAVEADFEPEWKRVVPGDKELRACIKWLWSREGYDYDVESGKRVKICDE